MGRRLDLAGRLITLMPRLPSNAEIPALIDNAHGDLDFLERLWPEVRAHLHRNAHGWPSQLPGAEGGGGGHGKGGHSDRVLATIARLERVDEAGNHIGWREDVTEEQRDWLALQAVRVALEQIQRTRIRLANRLPALAAQLAGLDLAEVVLIGSGVTGGSRGCIACGAASLDPIRRGMDNKCYQAWVRAGRPDLERFKADRKKIAPPAPAESSVEWDKARHLGAAQYEQESA